MSLYSFFKKSASRRDFSFYEKTAGAAMAVAAVSGQAHGAIVYTSAVNATTTGDLLPGVTVGLEISSQYLSTAYGYVNGIGTLVFPDEMIYRESDGTVDADDFVDNVSGFNFDVTSPASGALQDSDDNYVGFSFSDPSINGGAPLYGWAQLHLPLAEDPEEGMKILSYAYEDSGAPILLGAVPEPSGLALFALGAVGTTAFHRRRRSSCE